MAFDKLLLLHKTHGTTWCCDTRNVVEGIANSNNGPFFLACLPLQKEPRLSDVTYLSTADAIGP